MKRILHVSAMGERGGLEAVLLNALKALDRNRFKPQVVLLSPGPFGRELEEAGVPTRVIDAGRVRNVVKGGRALAEIIKVLKADQVDLVHNWNHKAHLYGGIAARLAGIPAVYHLHGVPKPALTRDRLVSALSMAVPAAATLACSTFVAKQFDQSVWRRWVRVLPNGTGFHHALLNDVTQIRRRLNIAERDFLVVMVGRLQRWKGVHVFVDAAAQVVKRHSNVHFLVVGGSLFGLEKEYARELREQVKSLELDHAVTMMGFQQSVQPFFQAADIVVHCSIEPEPFGMVLLEAMACEKPVVASDSGGPREIVVDGETGLLVPPNNPERLAQGIMELLGDETLRASMGRAGASRVRQCFTAERMAQELEAVYADVIAHHGRS